eukprot:8005865-Pyramimonas_sp.AAC.1
MRFRDFPSSRVHVSRRRSRTTGKLYSEIAPGSIDLKKMLGLSGFPDFLTGQPGTRARDGDLDGDS